MVKQILLGTVVGAVVIFIVSSIWHVVLPFSETGFHLLPHEEILTTAMRLGISEPGIYPFPGMDPAKRSDPVEAQKFAEKFRRGPTGLIIFRPGGTEFSFPRLLVYQFGFQVMAAFVLSLLLAMSASALPGYPQRVFFVALVALFSSLLIDLPYWNWYGFPGNYTAEHLAEMVLTWGVTGLALAAVVKPRSA
jgi:hypothetical protein